MASAALGKGANPQRPPSLGICKREWKCTTWCVNAPWKLRGSSSALSPQRMAPAGGRSRTAAGTRTTRWVGWVGLIWLCVWSSGGGRRAQDLPCPHGRMGTLCACVCACLPTRAHCVHGGRMRGCMAHKLNLVAGLHAVRCVRVRVLAACQGSSLLSTSLRSVA